MKILAFLFTAAWMLFGLVMLLKPRKKFNVVVTKDDLSTVTYEDIMNDKVIF